jgi:hypothetical protein
MTRNKQAATTRTHQLTINGKPATDAEYARIMHAKPKPAPMTSANATLSSNRGFNFWR